MTAVTNSAPSLASRLVNQVLSIKPLANLARNRARNMMVKRAASMGVYWGKEVELLRARGTNAEFAPEWQAELDAVTNPNLAYPAYYLKSFHAYDQGNLSWEAATEVEVAACTVHSRVFSQENDIEGDPKLRQSYHNILKAQLPESPKDILDLGCSVGLSSFALQKVYPEANVTGVDLSPYFLAIARYRSQQQQLSINWVHAAAEATGLPDASFDLVSASLLYHELPQVAALQILQEARRLLRPNGHFAIMEMNPRSEVYAKMPPYILTLLKSTEPYLDEYFALDMEKALVEAGFATPTITINSPRHRTIIAKVL